MYYVAQPTVLDVVILYVGLILLFIILVTVAWNLWLHYINTLFLKSIDWVMLEIVPPKEVHKSPAAMELVLNSLHAGDATNRFKRYWEGEIGLTHSLEIASIEGKIHFYVRFHKKFRKAFEAQLYSQYPQAEIKEVEDYTRRVPDYIKDGPINIFGYNLELSKDDPYPIKSYIDYGLDRAVGSLDEAERIDPITPMLETMGSIGIGEQLWVQILIQKDTKRHTVVNSKGEQESKKGWKDKAKEIIRKEKDSLKIKDEEGKITTVDRPTRGQQAVIEAIERHMNKLGFDCGIRVIYLADKEHFKGDMITAFTAMFRQFNSEDMNGFKLTNMTKTPDEPWKDLGGRKLQKKKKHMLADYKDRDYFFGSFKFKKIKTYFKHPEALGQKPFILSTEELATLWHLPGRVAETPTFTRQEAKKSEPPVDLPI